MCCRISEMIGDKIRSSVHIHRSVEVVQDKKTGEQVTGRPKWVGNPGIEISIIVRGRIVGDDRWSFRGIVVIDDLGFQIIVGRDGWTLFSRFTGIRAHGKSDFGQHPIKLIQGRVGVHRQLACIPSFYYGFAQFTGYSWSNGIIGYPAIFRGNPDFGQTALGCWLIIAIISL